MQNQQSYSMMEERRDRDEEGRGVERSGLAEEPTARKRPGVEGRCCDAQDTGSGTNRVPTAVGVGHTLASSSAHR